MGILSKACQNENSWLPHLDKQKYTADLKFKKNRQQTCLHRTKQGPVPYFIFITIHIVQDE